MFLEEIDCEKDHVTGLDVGEHPAARQVRVGIQKPVGEREDDRESLRDRRLPHACSLGSVGVMPRYTATWKVAPPEQRRPQHTCQRLSSAVALSSPRMSRSAGAQFNSRCARAELRHWSRAKASASEPNSCRACPIVIALPGPRGPAAMLTASAPWRMVGDCVSSTPA